jgi:hypothetical protein
MTKQAICYHLVSFLGERRTSEDCKLSTQPKNSISVAHCIEARENCFFSQKRNVVLSYFQKIEA